MTKLPPYFTSHGSRSSWKRGQRKRRIIAHLRGIDRALNARYSHSLATLERSLRQELDLVLEQEESLWAQKSRCHWCGYGNMLKVTLRSFSLLPKIRAIRTMLGVVFLGVRVSPTEH
ncbi:hypothetical protein V6N13_137745 [Hibiscus sabdariffa]